jgi:hypothetical protein
MALMNYDAVSKLADYLYLKGRDKFARSPETKYRLTLEKDLQYWISQIGRFYSEADLDGRRAIKDIILAGSMKDLDSELRVLKTIISKIGELKSCDDQTLIQHFTRPLISSDSVPLSSYLPSCSVANGLRLGLGLCFVQYAFDQFSSVVFGISKIVGQGPVGAPVAFTLGIMSMLISLTRYGVWAGKLVDKFEDAWNLSKKNPELKYWIRAALGFGAVSAFLSPGGSIEVALKGIKNYDNVELYKLAPVFKFYVDHHLELPLAIGPGFISGAVVNCPGNMNIAVQALLAIDYLCQLYRKSDRAPFLETLEDRAVSDVFNLIKAMVGDNRHFSGEDILKMHNGLDVRTLVLERSQHQADDLSATRSAAADRNQPVAKATGGGLRRLASTPFLHAADRATTPAGSHQAQGGRDEFRPIPVHKPREEKGSRSSSSSNEA